MYVDNLILIGPTKDSITQLKQLLEKEYNITDLGEINWILGMKISWNHNSLTISQSQYITCILERYRMDQSKPVKMPMDPSLKLKKSIAEDPQCKRKTYQQVMGSLMYAMIGTCPDIADAVSSLSQYNADTSQQH